MKTAEGAGKNCEMIGASGEQGCYQYMPGRFAVVSRATLGQVLEWNPLNEEYVTVKYIQKRLRSGLTANNFALEWNQGNYKLACHSGVNGKGVAYDSCQYSKNFSVAYNNQHE